MREIAIQQHVKHHGRPDVSGKKVLIVGLGISGLWTARWLLREGAAVTITDIKPRPELDGAVCEELEGLGAVIEPGGHPAGLFLNADLIIVSPGVSETIEPIRGAVERGIPVMGELELAGRLVETPMVAVTGTNGKSTVAVLVGHMLRSAGLKTFVGGNIGTPLMAYACGEGDADAVVAEVSSFQLDTSETFSPRISVILNISPDHLDRYPDYEAYARSKLRICENQGAGQWVVLNDDDERLGGVAPETGVNVLRYGRNPTPGRQACFQEGGIRAGLEGRPKHRFTTEQFRLPGEHNAENLMAAVLAAMAFGCGAREIQQAINSFEGLPHRLEFVGEQKGIRFYNDSKATNVDAAVRAIQSFPGPLIWIAGGRHKGADYDPLVGPVRDRVKAAVFLGEAKELLAARFRDLIPFAKAPDMARAVAAAASMAEAGDTVLLAPACSSFDMYRDYAHRGDVFRDAVRSFVRG